jgi:hypothetical protein
MDALRDKAGNVLYEVYGPDVSWSALLDEQKEPWCQLADKMIAAGGWQPIETVPKEPDKPVLLWLDDLGPVICSWVPAGEFYEDEWWNNWLEGSPYGLRISSHYKPTHWLPINSPI